MKGSRKFIILWKIDRQMGKPISKFQTYEQIYWILTFISKAIARFCFCHIHIDHIHKLDVINIFKGIVFENIMNTL